MREIILTRGQVALVDDDDFEWLNRWSWHAVKGKTAKIFYAARMAFERKESGGYRRWLVFMHREILGVPKEVEVDHRNFNGCDNQRHNLRPATGTQNQAHRRKWAKGTSKFKGVSWSNARQKWCASIMVKRKSTNLGRFKSETEAAHAYNVAALREFGEFAVLNELKS